MHFKVRILAQLVDADEHAALAGGCAQLCAAVGARLPDRGNARGNFTGGSAIAQHSPEVDPRLRVQAQIPESIGGQAAAVARAAEGRSGRSNDSENRSV